LETFTYIIIGECDFGCRSRMKEHAEESEVKAIQVSAPFKRVVKLLVSPERGMEIPGLAEPVLGMLRAKKLTVGITEVPPGGGLAPHTHEDTEEVIYVLSGTAEYTIEGKKIPIKPGTILHIPPKVKHEAKNNGSAMMKQIWCTSPVK